MVALSLQPAVLCFIAATRDGKIRGFNKTNGKLLWEYKLPVLWFCNTGYV